MDAEEFDISLMRPRLPNAEAIASYLSEIDTNQWYSNYGPLEQRLRSRFADMFSLGSENVVLTANGTLGLAMALREAARGLQGLCVMPSFTFVASAHAAVAAGLTPHFIDVDIDSWGLDADYVRQQLASIGEPVRAVLAVAPFGAPLNIATWDTIELETGVPVVIDAAAGIDTVTPGQCPTIVSLHATKPLGIGEGGLILCKDENRARELFFHTNFGFRGRRSAESIGFNGKLSEYAAAVGHAALDGWERVRRRNMDCSVLYTKALQDLGGIELAPGSDAAFAKSTFNILLPEGNVDNAIAFMHARGIEVRQWWSKGCHREPAFQKYSSGNLPVTEKFGRCVLGLPFFADLTAREIARIRSSLENFLS